MKKLFYAATLCGAFITGCTPAEAPKEQVPAIKPVIIGYVGGYNGNIIDIAAVDAKRLTHINYAFVDVQNKLAHLTNEATDTVNFRLLNSLKQINPDLKLMISVGGWTWSKNFSDAVLTPESNNAFAQSCVDIVAKHNLDGVDIDWEYPGMVGDGNVFRPEDRTNYTLMFKAIREKLDILGKETGKYYFVTTAIGGSREFLQHTEMEKAQEYLDFINIMTYDFDGTYDNMAAHHANLSAPENMPYIYSAELVVENLAKVGVEMKKVVMGLAFYSKGRIVKGTNETGLYDIPVRPMWGGGYTFLKDSLVNQKGFVRYWDEASKAPYLYNADKKIFLTYDDEESVKAKCLYVKEKGLGGVMFWEYFSDSKLYLLKAINEELGMAHQ